MEQERIALPSVKAPDNGMWRDHAKCKEMGNDTFFNHGDKRGRKAHEAIKETVRFCQDCTVIKECLRFALENDIAYGVWGGTTPEERKVMVKSFCNASAEAE
jgi:WhiB family redox-sensing transcriptional regulator